MEKQDLVTKILAILGTVLVWLPLLMPVIFFLVSIYSERIPIFDYLMPAELFPLVLTGGIILFWATLRARSHQRLIGWTLLVIVLMLVGSQGLANITGLATGEIEPTGLPWAIVVSLLVLYDVALVALGISGISLLRTLYKK